MPKRDHDPTYGVDAPMPTAGDVLRELSEEEERLPDYCDHNAIPCRNWWGRAGWRCIRCSVWFRHEPTRCGLSDSRQP